MSSPQTLLSNAQISIKNAEKVIANKGALISLTNAQTDITNALKLLNTSINPIPTLPANLYRTAIVVFNETWTDLSQWTTNDGGNQNGVTTYSTNVQIQNNIAILTVASATSGANLSTINYGLEIGQYVEFNAYFPGQNNIPNNWMAVWAGKKSNWPASGEPDVFEGLGYASCGYQSPLSDTNSVKISGVWVNDFHKFGAWRQSNKIEYYWDGTLVHTFTTNDDGGTQPLALTAGYDPGRGPLVTGSAGALQVKSVTAWALS